MLFYHGRYAPAHSLSFLGQSHPSGTRLADVQKCVRTGDIDEVGRRFALHFFEMLGNWSLGDYFKEQSIKWSFEFLTSDEYLGLDANRLAVSVFEGRRRRAARRGVGKDMARMRFEGRADFFSCRRKTIGGLRVLRDLAAPILKFSGIRARKNAAPTVLPPATAENILKYGTMFSCSTTRGRTAHTNLWAEKTSIRAWDSNARFASLTALTACMKRMYSRPQSQK